MAEYQVWHKNKPGNRFDKVAEVDVGNPQAAALFTVDGFGGVEDWRDQPSVKAMPGEHRSTTLGDIIIDSEGTEYLFGVKEGGYPGFTEVTTIFDQGYTEYLATQAIEDAALIGFDPTGVDVYLSTERPPGLAAEHPCPKGWESVEGGGHESLLQEPTEPFDGLRELETMFAGMADMPDFDKMTSDPRAAYDRLLDDAVQPETERPKERGMDR